jgi:hypothetical protein
MAEQATRKGLRPNFRWVSANSRNFDGYRMVAEAERRRSKALRIALATSLRQRFAFCSLMFLILRCVMCTIES